jgi:N-acetylglucosaminyldiphosphoundecaprenol N-acetyl-beta-D-mannosaminyltransferase
MNDTAALTGSDDLVREVYCVLGIPIDAIEMPEALNRIEAAATAAASFLISTPNLNFMVNSQTDEEFRESLLLSDLCPADGMPIIWIARLLGIPIKRRVAGSDILDALKSKPNKGGPLKIFVFGATDQVAAAAANRLNSHSSALKCVGWACPGFVNVDELSQDRYIDQINSSSADFLVAALGARNGQVWLLRNHTRLRVPVRAHLGAAINFQAGTVKRAPDVMRRLGFEWLWRIKEEPHLFGRYCHDGGVLIRLLLTRVLPLSVTSAWQRLRPKRGRGDEGLDHDFVTVHVHNQLEATLRVSGDATARQVAPAIASFRQAGNSQKLVTVDLSRTGAIDPRYFGLFLMLRKQLKGRGAHLRFVGVPPRLQRLFRLNGLGFLLSSSEECNVDAIH